MRLIQTLQKVRAKKMGLKTGGQIISIILSIFILSTAILPKGSVSAQTIGQCDLDHIYKDTVWYDPCRTACVSGGGDSIPLTGNDNVQKAYNYFLARGFSPIQSAGIVGNLYEESGGVDPTSNQNGGGPGRGIAQWGVGGRWDTTPGDNVLEFAKQQGKDPFDLGLQLDFIWFEMNNVSPWNQALASVHAATSLKEAVDAFMNDYEKPGDPHEDLRLQDAQLVYDTYGPGGSGGTIGSTSSASCTGGVVNCTDPSLSGLSPVRQNVVCITKQELALWTSQPGYPHPAFSQTGYYKYSDNVAEEWCADFVSWIYSQASYPFSGGLSGGWRLPAVSSIQALGQQNQNFHWHSESSYVPKPGDIAIHGDHHTNIFISSSGGSSVYIGGDQGDGPYPGGSIVSSVTQSGYYSGGITGYVSPD